MSFASQCPNDKLNASKSSPSGRYASITPLTPLISGERIGLFADEGEVCLSRVVLEEALECGADGAFVLFAEAFVFFEFGVVVFDGFVCGFDG